MQEKSFTKGLLDYIHSSPTPFHAVDNGIRLLLEKGFQPLEEGSDLSGLQAGSYFLTRNGSSLIAFTLGAQTEETGPMRMAGAHTDSPCLKVKPNPIQCKSSTIQLGVEVYGGALLNPWFDRDLSLAGRICLLAPEGSVTCRLVNWKRPVAVIPSLAIHLDREANSKRSINKQTDLTPIIMLAAEDKQPLMKELLQEQLAKEHPDTEGMEILDWDLYFHDAQPPQQCGIKGELLTGARFDNLLSCYALLRALPKGKAAHNTMIVLNDHEEVGSVSTTGAQGPFLRTVIESLYPDVHLRTAMLNSSLFISSDNAHGVHPNFADKYDANHLPLLNGGPVIKKNANHRYASDGLTSAMFKLFCKGADVPYQEFVMRNDLACGSTIGPLTASNLGIPTVDIGAASLGMHSIRESVGNKDCWYLYRALSHFFQDAVAPISLQNG